MWGVRKRLSSCQVVKLSGYQVVKLSSYQVVMGAKSYRDLRIFVEANALEIEVHRLTLQLPKNELYELGSQTRRSMNSVRANIVEGYGRRAYKKEFVRFLVYSHASLLETISHLETIDQLYHPKGIKLTIKRLDELGIMIFNFLGYVQSNWKT